mmetsp:Transcript_39864/g.129066  ORF Transcript_39864/g.129066 Transcript_39864/m.129066 type:complete len:169 (-) Transcript_39864:1254-1760(-)
MSANQTRVKEESGIYRVVHAPSVLVRHAPGGRAVGAKSCGDVVRTDARTIGGETGGWVRLRDERFGGAPKGGLGGGGEGWMLLSGAKIGLGVLLVPVDDRAAREVRRYRVRATPHAAVCESPGGPPIGKRISPDLPRSPHRWSSDRQACGGARRALRLGGGRLGAAGS